MVRVTNAVRATCIHLRAICDNVANRPKAPENAGPTQALVGEAQAETEQGKTLEWL